jgi:hypothetical protein
VRRSFNRTQCAYMAYQAGSALRFFALPQHGQPVLPYWLPSVRSFPGVVIGWRLTSDFCLQSLAPASSVVNTWPYYH